ncbi:MAG: SIS domain-containing protein [Terracidiphilus sp.]
MSNALERNAKELQALLAQAETFEAGVSEAARNLASALRSGNKLLACGNGGSAADASHFTTEFVCRFQKDRRPYPAISLATQGGDLTAIGNDYDFADVFSRQVKAFGAPGDVLAVFTTSGRSENVRRALEAAKARRILTLAFLGRDGGSCRGIADIEFLVRSETTARIQEMHKLLMHTICELAEEQL